jgi:hypothetical protein
LFAFTTSFLDILSSGYTTMTDGITTEKVVVKKVALEMKYFKKVDILLIV